MVETAYLMTSFVLSLFYLLPAAMVVAAASWAGFAVGPGTAGSWPGGPWNFLVEALVMVLVVPATAPLLARVACRVQRHRLRTVFGIEERTPPDPLAPVGGRLRPWGLVFGRESWSMVVYTAAAGLHGLLFGGAVVVLVVGGSAVAVGALAGVGFILVQGQPSDLGAPVLAVAGALPVVLAGMAAAPHAVSTEVVLHRALLFDAPEVRMRRRLSHVQDSRLRMVDAAEAERRRIERDLHDGAQQRLLALTLTLTRARARMGSDPGTALELIAEAQRESREVMEDLREVARGLHPRVLTDHGLGAALPVVAGRSPVPAKVDVDLDGRPSARAEGTAYYVVCEALTNVAKHAGARRVTVSVRRVERPARRGGDLVRVAVADDGVGGASPDAGSGLYGLWDRVDAVDGVLAVHSPTGGGTVLTADIPWEA